MELMSRFAEDLSMAENKSVSFVQKDTRARLAEALLLLEKSFGINANGQINIVLTREDIASIAGMATETAVRVLKEWEEEHNVLLEKKFIKINNANKLYSLAKLED